MYLARPLLSSAGDLYLTALTGMSCCSMCPQDRIIQQGVVQLQSVRMLLDASAWNWARAPGYYG
jgi:hypothetical protein